VLRLIQLALDDLLKDYKEEYKRPLPVRYNINHFPENHKKYNALLRRYWKDLHPLVRDLFTSFTLEFGLVTEKIDKAVEEKEAAQRELEERENDLNQKIQSIEEKYQEKLDELGVSSKNQIEDLNFQHNKQIEELQIQISNLIEDHEKNRNEHDTEIDDLKIQLQSKIDNIENLTKVLETKDKFISEKTVEIKDKKGETSQFLETTAGKYEEFLNQLDLLEKQNTVLDAEKYQKSKLIEKLSEKIKRDNLVNKKRLEASEKSTQKYRINFQQMRKKMEQIEENNLALSRSVKVLENDLKMAFHEKKELKTKNHELLSLLKNQISINKEYDILTRNVIMIKAALRTKEGKFRSSEPMGVEDEPVEDIQQVDLVEEIVVEEPELIPVPPLIEQLSGKIASSENETIPQSSSEESSSVEIMEPEEDLSGIDPTLSSILSDVRGENIVETAPQEIRHKRTQLDDFEEIDLVDHPIPQSSLVKKIRQGETSLKETKEIFDPIITTSEPRKPKQIFDFASKRESIVESEEKDFAKEFTANANRLLELSNLFKNTAPSEVDLPTPPDREPKRKGNKKRDRGDPLPG
jgi:myosin heavy subunit